jgi:hypothetical protein
METNDTGDSSIKDDSSVKDDVVSDKGLSCCVSCPTWCYTSIGQTDGGISASANAYLSPEALEAIEKAKSEISAASIERFMQAGSYVPPATYAKVVRIMNALAANPNLDDALGKLARMAERTGLPDKLKQLASCIDQIPDEIFDHLIDAVQSFDEDQFNQFCETMETLDPKAIAVFTEAAYYAAKVASEHVPTADQINSAAKASVDQVNRLAKNPNTSKAYDNLHYAATETGLPTQLKTGAAYAYSRLPTRPIDQLVDATAGLTHEQIKNVDVVTDTVGGIHPETAGKFMELGKSMTTEQLRCLVNAANHMKPEDLMALKEKAVEYGKSNSE